MSSRSPLIISTDLTKIATNALNILKNTRIIALNVSVFLFLFRNLLLSSVDHQKQQDSLGKSISFKKRYTNDHDVWSGSLSDGSTVAGKRDPL